MNQTITSRLHHLRQHMQQQHLDAWIVPSADPHLSEYLPEHWQTRRYLSGFTGSVGTLVITATHAGLWVDSRYWEQAPQQLANSGIELHKIGQDIDYPQWLAEHLPENSTAGIAPDMLSLASQRLLTSQFMPKNIQLRHDKDIINAIWSQRPPLPQQPIYCHDPQYSDHTAAEKIERLRQYMHTQNASHHLISTLDDTAWITNLRGSDVSYNPVFLSHLLITPNETILFAAVEQLSNEARNALEQAHIQYADYHSLDQAIARIENAHLLIDPAKVAISTLNHLPQSTTLIEHINPSTLFKSIKTEHEMAHIRQAMVQDGIALCGFFAEFEQRLADGIPTTELDIDHMLLTHRQQREGFVSPSFGTIAGFNANGAMPHYSATPEQHSTIKGQGLLLIDSGAQYLNGTTDITRVVPVGTPTPAQQRDYTLVLKAHIALAQAVFPENIAAPMIDAICRMPMWQAQCNYGHGTGHGVGFFLNVHEGPQVIAYPAVPQPHHAMKAGMLTSNEPGLYRPGKWGIRIENLVLNQPVEHPQETEFGAFLCFETVTLCPIDTRLIDVSLMTPNEIQWLNDYHQRVRTTLEPLTQGSAREWLIQRTAAL